MKNAVAALAGGDAADKLWTEGIYIAGERFVVFKAERRSVYGRKVRFPFINSLCFIFEIETL